MQPFNPIDRTPAAPGVPEGVDTAVVVTVIDRVDAAVGPDR